MPRFPKNIEGETVDLALSKKMTYDQFAAKLAEALHVDPTHIRFSTMNATTLKPKSIVRRNPNQNLYQILHPQFTSYNSHQRNDALFYEVLDISLSELETKKNIRLAWVSEGLTKEVLVAWHFFSLSTNDMQEPYELLVAKNGTIGNLLAELKKKANLEDQTVEEARVYSVQSGRIVKELGLDYPVSSILEYQNLFAERIPEDERTIEEGDRAINAFHFDKEPNKVHGVPFKFYLKPVSL